MKTFNKTIVFRIKDKAIFEVPLSDEIIIGSDKTCDFCIPNVTMKQCRITNEDSNVFIQNLSEAGMVILNGKPLNNEKIVFADGILILGKINFEIEIKSLVFSKKEKQCSKCGCINGASATICRKCGCPLNSISKDDNSINKIKRFISKYKYALVGLLAVAFVTIGVIVGFAMNKPNEDSLSRSESAELINLSEITISPIDNQIYTGSEITCPVEVFAGDVLLEEGADYTCAYENNVGVGSATVTINGNESTTTGSNTTSFSIITGDSVCDNPTNGGVVAFVERVYVYSLNRYPDSDSLITYVNQLVNQQISVNSVVNDVFNSEELNNLNLSNEDFLTSIYRGVLNREPDDGGFNSNLSLLSSGMSRSNFVSNIVDSDEFVRVCESSGVPLISPFEAISHLNVGDTFYYGNYNNEPIEWEVLETENHEMLVLATDAVNLMAYSSSIYSSSWDNSLVSEWMNTNFYDAAFNQEEQSYIDYAPILNNYYYTNESQNNILDKLFLLSEDEVRLYFDSDSARICSFDGEPSWWWFINGAVGDNGVVHTTNIDYSQDNRGVRPAMWLNFVSLVSGEMSSIEYISACDVGDSFYYGNYDGMPVEWVVLNNEGNQLLVITNNAINYLPYYEDNVQDYVDLTYNTTWETSTLRLWLNNDFYYSSFSESEQSRVLLSYVNVLPNPIEGGNPGNDTEDRLFLLSIDEANTYLSVDNSCEYRHVPTYWWLRNSSSCWCSSMTTYNSEPDNYFYYYQYSGVRPAMWIDVS